MQYKSKSAIVAQESVHFQLIWFVKSTHQRSSVAVAKLSSRKCKVEACFK